jgi:hypothetical protein
MRCASILLLSGCVPLVTHEIDPYSFERNHAHSAFHSAWFNSGSVPPSYWVGHWCSSPAFEATYRMKGRTAVAEICRHRKGCAAVRHGYLAFDVMCYVSRSGRRPFRLERIEGQLVAVSELESEALDFACGWVSSKNRTILIEFAGKPPEWRGDSLLLAYLRMYPSVLKESDAVDPAEFEKRQSEKAKAYKDACLLSQLPLKFRPVRPR